MFSETPKISLTINLEGSHKPRFVYDCEQGRMVRYYGKIVMERDPKSQEFTGKTQFVPCESKCTTAIRQIILSEKFVENAIEDPVKGFSKKKWYQLPIKARINKHVRNLAKQYLHTQGDIDHHQYNWKFVPELTE